MTFLEKSRTELAIEVHREELAEELGAFNTRWADTPDDDGTVLLVDPATGEVLYAARMSDRHADARLVIADAD